MNPNQSSLLWDELQKRINYRFRDSYLLREAMTHPSFLNDRDFAGNNQRLEFLGDSVLGLLTAERLFTEHRGLAEGALTHMKSIIVSERVLAKIAYSLQLELCLRRSSSVKKGAHRPEAYLADALEALLGAIYLDGGWEAARIFRDEIFWPMAYPLLGHEDMIDHRGLLLRLAQSQGLPQPLYTDLNRTGPDHEPIFTVEVIWNGQILAQGQGSTKKNAAADAAHKALDILKEMSEQK